MPSNPISRPARPPSVSLTKRLRDSWNMGQRLKATDGGKSTHIVEVGADAPHRICDSVLQHAAGSSCCGTQPVLLVPIGSGHCTTVGARQKRHKSMGSATAAPITTSPDR